jgi:hypothetical protein
MAGTQTATIYAGGIKSGSPGQATESEEWNGSGWTEGNNLNTGRHNFGNAGTQTAALAISGQSPPINTEVEQYDGSSWTEIADVNTGRLAAAGCGTTTAALFYAGLVLPNTNIAQAELCV